jgi:hypothetical protein
MTRITLACPANGERKDDTFLLLLWLGLTSNMPRVSVFFARTRRKKYGGNNQQLYVTVCTKNERKEAQRYIALVDEYFARPQTERLDLEHRG